MYKHILLHNIISKCVSRFCLARTYFLLLLISIVIIVQGCTKHLCDYWTKAPANKSKKQLEESQGVASYKLDQPRASKKKRKEKKEKVVTVKLIFYKSTTHPNIRQVAYQFCE